jgi:flagellar hook-basal body complex protein FliE
MQITPIQPFSPNSVSGLTGTTGSNATSNTQSPGKTFNQLLDSLNQSQTNADNLVTQMANGGDVDLHDVMIATEENDVNFRVALAIRDRLVDAYRQVMQMNV